MSKKATIQADNIYNFWKVLEAPKARTVLCLCLKCNKTIKKVDYTRLISDKSKSCGCNLTRSASRNKIKVGDKFEHWEVLEPPTTNNRVLCLCTLCKNTKLVSTQNLLNQTSKSCGCTLKHLPSRPLKIYKTTKTDNLKIDDKQGCWRVAEKLPEHLIVQCTVCNLTTKKMNFKRFLSYNGKAASCGCLSKRAKIKINLIYGGWRVIGPLDSEDRALCLCAVCLIQKRKILSSDLLNKPSYSCGCASKKAKVVEGSQISSWQVLKTPLKSERKVLCKCTLCNSTERYIEYYDLIRYSYLEGCGCSPTYDSKAELEILEWVQKYYPSATKKRFKKQEVDIFIPELNLGIEHNGLYWHSELFKENNYHLNKTQELAKQNIRLIHIWDYEWKFKQDQIKSFLLSAINKNEYRIGARKCKLIWSNSKEEIRKAHELLNATHIQESTNSTKYVTNVYFQDKLIATATFSRHPRNSKEWVLSRFTTQNNYTIQGILSKISKIASNKLKSDIISWADYRLSEGKGYIKANWLQEKLHPADYFYFSLKTGKVVSKQVRQKRIVGTPEGMTEKEHAKLDGLTRVYDCGKIRFRYKYSKIEEVNDRY